MQNAYNANMYFKRVKVQKEGTNVEMKAIKLLNDARLVRDPHGLLHSFEPIDRTMPWKVIAIRMFGKGYAPRTVLGRLVSWGYKTPRSTQTIKNWKVIVEKHTALEFRKICKVSTGSALYTGRPEVANSQRHDTERANMYLNHIDDDVYDRHVIRKNLIELWKMFNGIIE